MRIAGAFLAGSFVGYYDRTIADNLGGALVAFESKSFHSDDGIAAHAEG
jgi:hypothetical protein